ncbi:MAG TPA: bifunctional pyr operon transcriptional regulator/uracil phosphoribosyltransferase PyrR [Caldimonas sp.]|nr:bifunctional pyr operon transcriptional regulator/uracil phosphoribosyltransferase PyrR [Caldimonas sp.]
MGSALEALRERTLMSAPQIDRIIARLAHQIVEPEDAQQGVVLIGIRRGGEQLARRLAAKIEEISGRKPGIGFLNINLYRDDDVARALPESEILEDLAGKVVIVVDDVLYTGRTIRAAIDALLEYGRPARVQLAVLADRGHRELPIRPDYVGKNLPTAREERVQVQLVEIDEIDQVLLIEQPEEAAS